MKKVFEAPRMEMILMQPEDIITTSGDNGDNWGEWDPHNIHIIGEGN